MDQQHVKSFRTGILCLGLLVCGNLWGQAQPTKPPEERQAPPGSASRPTIQQPPPPPPKLPDVRQQGETGWWIGLNGWLPTQKPIFDKGKGATFTEAARVEMQGKPKYAEGAEVGFAVGLHNTLRFTYFETKASGNITSIPTTLQLWGQTYQPGTFLATNYRLQNGKISFDYLTWPYPIESRRFRLKTLWQVQYTSIRTAFDAPLLPLFDPTTGAPILDASGNPISYAGIGSRWFVSPEFGLNTTYYSGRHVRFEANASGWTFPHRNTIWDADASMNFKYGHIELRVGGKAFHFKTSTKAEYYGIGTMGSAFVGVRWYSQ
jgi:hypothetical protein